MILQERWPIVDIRHTLEVSPDKRARVRPLSEVHGLVVHHTAGSINDSPEVVARGHVARGWPSIGYHFWIQRDGTILQCAALSSIVNHSKGQAPVPHVRPNQNFGAVVFPGDYRSTEATREQRAALLVLFMAMQIELDVQPDMLFTHNEFKATQCPGRHLINEVAELVSEEDMVRTRMPRNVLEAQKALAFLGAQIEVDGRWGPQTSEAMLAATGNGDFNFKSSYRLAERLWVYNQPLARERL